MTSQYIHTKMKSDEFSYDLLFCLVILTLLKVSKDPDLGSFIFPSYFHQTLLIVALTRDPGVNTWYWSSVDPQYTVSPGAKKTSILIDMKFNKQKLLFIKVI